MVGTVGFTEDELEWDDVKRLSIRDLFIWLDMRISGIFLRDFSKLMDLKLFGSVLVLCGLGIHG